MKTPNTDRRQRGFSLAEIVVAVAVFALIFIAVLAVYDTSNKDFKSGVERSEMQQNTRVAYEKLVAEVRQAGFDYDRDGFPSGAGSAAWQKNRAYGVGNVVSPITANGFTYRATVGGTSGSTEPAWNTTINGTTTDNTVTWKTEPGVNQYQQPDEQIEFAHRRALTIRANFDYETARLDPDEPTKVINGREKTLETPQFPVITTNNDEIVTYALRSKNGPNPDKIQFYADVPTRRAHPGGAPENLVQIPNVDLCTTGTCTNPPYDLYRFTFKPVDSESGPNPPLTLVEAPIATNVREVDFTYYSDAVGTGTPLAFTPAVANTAGSSGGGQYNPNLVTAGSEARGRRAEIKAIRISLTGMNATQDRKFVNPREAAGSPARNYRTYTLESLVVPRNLGKMGVREQAEAPPGEPQLTSVETNWCGGVKVKWQAPPPPTGDTGDVDQYIIIYDTVAPPVRYQKPVGPATEGYVEDLDPTKAYFFTVAAVNSFGTTVAHTAAGNVEYIPTGSTGLSVVNKTTPEAPSGLLASGGGGSSPAIQKNRITLSWNNPLANLSPASTTCYSLSGACASTVAPVLQGELLKYEILRGKEADFDPTDPDEYEIVSTALPNVLHVGPSASTFEDNTAVACTDYYYRIRLVERCHNVAGANQPPAKPYSEYHPAYVTGTPNAILGRAEADAAPSKPATLINPLPGPGVPESNFTENPGHWTIYLQWPKVKTDVTTKTIAVEKYVITRKQMKGATVIATEEFEVEDTTPAGGQYFTSGPDDEPWYRDSDNLPVVDTADGVNYQYVYTVRARLACSPDLDSAESPELRFPCPYTGPSGAGLSITAGGMEDGNGLSLATAWLTDASGSSSIMVTPAAPVQSVQVLLLAFSSNTVVDLGIRSGSPFVFPITGTDTGELYRAYVIVKDTNGCQHIELRYVEEGTTTGCCLAAFANDPLVMTYSPNTSFVDVLLRNECGDDLQVQPNGIRITWNPAITPSGTKLAKIEYPGESGGIVTQNVNDATGSVTLSLPTGARNPIRAGETLKLQLQFSTILTNDNSPLTNFCVSYQRDGIDLSNQNCRIVPQPNPDNPNSCN